MTNDDTAFLDGTQAGGKAAPQDAIPANAMGAVSRRPNAAIVPDLERYRRHIARLDLPEDHKAELLGALWMIMKSFVDRAFGDDPVQHAQNHGEERAVEAAFRPLPVIQCDEIQTPENKETLSGTLRRKAVRNRPKETQ